MMKNIPVFYENDEEPPIINDMINRAISNINTFKETITGNTYNVFDENFIAACFTGGEFLKGMEHISDSCYDSAITPSLYLHKVIADMKTITKIKNSSYNKQVDAKYKGIKGENLLKAELLCVAAAKHNIPYFAAEYVANRLIFIRSISEDMFREAYELIEAKYQPYEEDKKLMSRLELISNDHFFGYINMRVTNMKATIGDCLHEFYIDEIIDNESCEFDLAQYFDECAEVNDLYKEINDAEALTDEIIGIATNERASLIHKLTPKQVRKRYRKGLFNKRKAELAAGKSSTC